MIKYCALRVSPNAMVCGSPPPFLYTGVSAVTCYGIALVIYSTHVGERWAEWVASVIFWVLAVFVYSGAALYVYRIFTKPLDPRKTFVGFLDIYIAFLHAISGVGMSLYLLDTAPLKDSWLLFIDTTASPYAIFVGNFVFTCVHVFNTAGYVTMKPRTSTVLGPLWGIAVSFTGLFMIAIVLTLVLRTVKKTVPLSKGVMDRMRKTRSAVIPVFRADYAGVYGTSQRPMVSLRHVGSMGRKELPVLKRERRHGGKRRK